MSEEKKKYKVPEDIELVTLYFQPILRANESEVTVIARYTQPTLNGYFLYLPLFEQPGKKSNHRIEILAQDEKTDIKLARKYKGFQSHQKRITGSLDQDEVILIKVFTPDPN